MNDEIPIGKSGDYRERENIGLNPPGGTTPYDLRDNSLQGNDQNANERTNEAAPSGPTTILDSSENQGDVRVTDDNADEDEDDEDEDEDEDEDDDTIPA